MEMERCPVCGWPGIKGEPCPRGCDVLARPAPPAPPAMPAVPPPPAMPEVAPTATAPPPQAVQPAMYQTEGLAALDEAPRRASKRPGGPAGIGGWLLLPIIGLILTLVWNAWAIYSDFLPFRQSDAWSALTTPGSSVYHWLWQPLALFEVFAAVVMVIAPLALLIAIFGKRRAARRYTVAFYVFCCVAVAIDSGACLLVMVDWLRSVGLNDAAADISTTSLRGLYQAALLAAIWIPYVLRSWRVRNTFVQPAPAADVDPAYFMAAAEYRRKGHGQVSGALVVAAVVLVAGAAVVGYNTFLPSSTGAVSTIPTEAQRLAQQADTEFASGDLAGAIALYGQATQADPTYEEAYYGQWTALLKNSDLQGALQVATRLASLFPGSRQAWFALGFTQEEAGDLKSAAASYSKSLSLAPPATAETVADSVIRQRLDFVSYVVAISEPRTAIAAAVARVSQTLASTPSQPASIASTASQVGTVLTGKIAELQKIQAPAYFAAFHAGMLNAYGDLQTTCEGLAGAAAHDDASALASAEKSFEDAIDAFNHNDAIGTSLINDYYQQQPPPVASAASTAAD